jgi:hypothetical protein
MVGSVSAIRVSQDYRQRDVQFRGIWTIGDWRWKIYSLRHPDREEVGEEFFEWLRVLAIERAATHPADSTVYGVGFVIAHAGKFGEYALIQWWGDEDILYNSVYVAPTGGYQLFELMATTGLTACVWELGVLDFERRAWVETVLKAGGDSSLDEYLSCTFNGLV